MTTYGFEANCSYINNNNNDYEFGINFKDSEGKKYNSHKTGKDIDKLIDMVYNEFVNSVRVSENENNDKSYDELEAKYVSLKDAYQLMIEDRDSWKRDCEILKKRIDVLTAELKDYKEQRAVADEFSQDLYQKLKIYFNIDGE